MQNTFWNKLEKAVDTFGLVLIYILLIFLPLSELFLHLLQSFTGLSESQIFWAVHFYEPAILLFLILKIVAIIILKVSSLRGGTTKQSVGVTSSSVERLPRAEKKFGSRNDKADWLIVAFIILALISVITHRSDLSRGLEGLRFLILPFIVYLVARLSNYKNPHKIIGVYLIISIIIAVIAVIEYFFLPKGYWSQFFNINSFGFGQNSLVATTQASSLLAGPNQLASYLLLAYFYFLDRFLFSTKKLTAEFGNYALVVVSLAIGLTYSRSALIGLVIGTIGMFWLFGRGQARKISYAAIFVAAIIAAVFYFALAGGELPRDILTHGSSFGQHLLATKSSAITFFHGGIIKILFGSGVGSAGPTALKLGGIVSENYYLQILFEVGVVGLIIFGFFVKEIVVRLFHSSKTLFFAFAALLVNAFFLHIFSDNPAMAVTIFVVVGLVVNVENQALNSKP
ncbi:MAG: hypothetical protein NTW79_02155 [Candidatus Berkelbacteria bacterium]|nr:hypothetical protein [Candidatus Berkelbacteria bacterium]